MSGQNTISSQMLVGFVERIERLEGQRAEIADDIRVVYAEAKAAGLTPKYVRKIVKRRSQKPSDVEEDLALTDLYLSAAGLAKETPLFRHVGQMAVDVSAREQVIEALKNLVPKKGDIIVRIGDQPVRLFRDESGDPQAEDYVEKQPRNASQPPSGKRDTAKPKTPPPDVDEQGAFDLGFKAAKDDQPVIVNPFPYGDSRRPRWDEGWRDGNGGDGMGPQE